jgi:hypothetical protein
MTFMPSEAAFAANAYQLGAQLEPFGAQRVEIKAAGCDGVMVRRNEIAALWAGKLQGLKDHDLTAYATDAQVLNLRDPIFAQAIKGQLAGTGHAITAEEVEKALARCYRMALHQAAETD